MESEKIKFQFWFEPVYTLKPPYVEIYIDNDMKFSGTIEKNNPYVEFYSNLIFSNHQIKLSKTSDDDVSLIINKLKIDDIDVRNIIWHKSVFKPNYNKDYSNENPNLEKEIKGELFFGHNGDWIFDFESPFYKFIVDHIRGN